MKYLIPHQGNIRQRGKYFSGYCTISEFHARHHLRACAKPKTGLKPARVFQDFYFYPSGALTSARQVPISKAILQRSTRSR
jgi:hypothetical protein